MIKKPTKFNAVLVADAENHGFLPKIEQQLLPKTLLEKIQHPIDKPEQEG